jgi:hypothetical protein
MRLKRRAKARIRKNKIIPGLKTGAIHLNTSAISDSMAVTKGCNGS